MKSKGAGYEMKDPFLIDYKQSLQEVVEGMKGVGSRGLHLLMIEMIRSRWIRDKRATYPFEIAWVFDKSEEGVSNILNSLEESGDLELAGLSRGKKNMAKPYKPKTLRKTEKPGTAKAKSSPGKRK